MLRAFFITFCFENVSLVIQSHVISGDAWPLHMTDWIASSDCDYTFHQELTIFDQISKDPSLKWVQMLFIKPLCNYVMHVLLIVYSPKLQVLLDSGVIGDVIHIQHLEPVWKVQSSHIKDRFHTYCSVICNEEYPPPSLMRLVKIVCNVMHCILHAKAGNVASATVSALRFVAANVSSAAVGGLLSFCSFLCQRELEEWGAEFICPFGQKLPWLGPHPSLGQWSQVLLNTG